MAGIVITKLSLEVYWGVIEGPRGFAGPFVSTRDFTIHM